MRRLAAPLIAPLAAAVFAGTGLAGALTGCSSSTSIPTSAANETVKVSGATGQQPTVHIPTEKASTGLVTRTVVRGTGSQLTTSDDYLANFNIYIWRGKTHKLLYSTYVASATTAPSPQMLPVKIGLSGLQTAMLGARVGSRVLAVLPPKYGYGSAGNSQIGVQPTDTLVWVIDVLDAVASNATATGSHVTDGGGSLPKVTAAPTGAPAIAVPKKSPPSNLVVTTLIKGTGPAVKSGQFIVVRYVGSIWRTGQVFNDNWPSSSQPNVPPSVFTLGKVITGWNTGLVGVPVGSRVMLVIPPKDGYGSAGQPSVGIKGTDTLVFVVDVLAATS